MFLTVNTKDRKPILAKEEAHAILLRAWEEARSWVVGRYVLMPDHIHLFVAPIDPRVPLGRWVRAWKAYASRKWPRPAEQPIWQVDYWDRSLRSSESYALSWEYVFGNPVRRGYVLRPEEWPYAGELNILDWIEP